jgi:hypothetical protein
LAVPNANCVVLVHLERGVNPAHWGMQEKETMWMQHNVDIVTLVKQLLKREALHVKVVI